jgi:O-methyltransferase involved in polyketide biosynthesis
LEANHSVPRKVELTGAQKTLFITLYAKALDSRSKHSILNDKKADEIIRSIDFNFEHAAGFGNKGILVVRAKQYDEWTREFLSATPNAVVLNLGCGLDSRILRVNPASSVLWFDLDFPDVINERRNYYSDRDNYRMIGSSITDSEWLKAIPKDRPSFTVADGVFAYLTRDDVKALFNRLTDHFPSGQIAFEVMSSLAMERAKSRLKNEFGAEHKWAVDDLREVDNFDPRIKRIDSFSLFSSKFASRLPISSRVMCIFARMIPSFKNTIRMLRYEFPR